MTLDNVLIVKLGGGEGLDLDAACEDLAGFADARPLVVVHGVSAMMNQLCLDAGIEVQTLSSPSGHSSRYTPPELRDLYVRAAEMANEEIVSRLLRQGVEAAGFVGANVALCAERKRAIRAVVNGRIRMIRDDHSGTIREVNGRMLQCALLEGKVPVLPPMAQSNDGMLNVDGDRAAAAVAAELQGNSLIILSNVRGLFRNFPHEDSMVREVNLSQIDNALNWAQGRMKRKVLAAQEALTQGVAQVVIADGRVANPVTQALAGAGTRFWQ